MSVKKNKKGEVQTKRDLVGEGLRQMGDEVPSFTLRADHPRHIHALMAAVHELPEEEKSQVRKLIREFDLYEEAHRP